MNRNKQKQANIIRTLPYRVGTTMYLSPIPSSTMYHLANVVIAMECNLTYIMKLFQRRQQVDGNFNMNNQT
ncbi:unnamed protein product [Acanthoscelides obtectus]|uniref:Uncharacterized protein n=1 Tax=Acanthoscelides obtectus TaxID=200917 RepID=A0A9P0JL88_ACAOB|nr:unnamed protein product [Acanthoscelides obtectus]CAK1628911.1 hypothetical protein AOBTE_LOCUS5462 [Acanthoscelides obtectus]